MGIGRYLLLFLLSANVFAIGSQARAPHIDVSLHYVKMNNSNTYRLGLLFKPDPGWHVYWRNPGDTGMAPQVAWKLPKDASISELHWPFPEQIPVAHLVNYGYHDAALLTAELELVAGAPIDISAQANWLVCQESCVPGEAALTLSLDSSRDVDEEKKDYELFRHWQPAMPAELSLLQSGASVVDGHLKLELYATSLLFKNAERVDVFIENTDVVVYDEEAELRWKNNYLFWRQALSEYFSEVPPHVDMVIVVDRQRAFRTRMLIKSI